MTAPRQGPRYEEVEIEISPDAPGRYRVKAKSFDGAVRRGTMELPVPSTELQGFLRSMARAVLPPAWLRNAIARDFIPESSPAEMRQETPREFGVRLYQALFRDQILLSLVEAEARRPEGTGLRIRLSFDMSRDDMPQVLGLPWELLAKSVDDAPLTVMPQYTLVRHLEVDKPAKESVTFEREFMVLVLMASPRGHGKLDLKQEEAELRKAWAGLPNVRVEFRRATRRNLDKSLKEEDPHVIHFMGHGDFREGRGVLLFETDDVDDSGQGAPDPVDAEALAIEFMGEYRLRLVFLNACRTAVTGVTSTTDPFAGVATSLVRGGVTAVLAMQFPITDDAAIAFSTVFYQALVDSEPVDAAVRAARNRVYSRDHAEWATPVLFMRSRSGDLFQRTDTRSSVAAIPSVQVVEPREEVAPPFTVFLATTSDRMRPWERRALRELPEHGITVQLAEPTPLGEHEAAIRACAGSADLFVHVLGDLPGEPVDGAPDGRSYAMEQYRIGHQCARAQLVFFPVGLTSAGVQDPMYRSFLEEIEQQPRRASRLEVITTSVDALVREILRKRTALLEAPVDTNGVYVDVHPKDVPAAAVVMQFLEQHGVKALRPKPEAAARGVVNPFEDAVRGVPLVIVVAGEAADDEWVKGRAKEALVAGAHRVPATEVAIVRLPGRGRPPRLPRVQMFGDGETIEEKRLEELWTDITRDAG
ncbi:MAG: CHAT domain-containing protein [Gemmatimonadaceae bacterium]